MTKGLHHLLTATMMTPAERAKGRFMRAPDHGDDDRGRKLTQADVDKAVADAVAKVQESVDRLEAKNAELLDEKKAAERKLRAASEIKPEDLQAAEERADKAEARVKELEKTAKDATTAKEKAEKALAEESTFTSKLLIQDGLKSALIANGVKDEDYIDMAVAKFASAATVKIDGDKREALIGDKPLPDAIKEWAATDAGKKVVAAPANSGGGAQGGKGGEGGKTMPEAEFNALPAKERSAFMADGGTIATAA